MALAPSSPAVDAGDDANCSSTDQRGIARPHGAHCDIGAFELVVDDPPVCVDYSGTVGVGGTLNATLGCSDPDAGDSITLAAASQPTHGSLTLNPDGSFTYRAAAGFTGSDSFTYQATDSHGEASGVGTATLTVEDTAPVCTDLSATTYPGWYVYDPGAVTGTLPCSDPDPGDTITYTAVSGAIGLKPDGTFMYVPPSSFIGTATFTYQATDSFGVVSNVGTATITVAYQPPTCADLSLSIHSGQTGDVNPNISADCTDLDPHESWTLAVVSGPAHGTAGVFNVWDVGGLHYTSNPTFVGTDTFTYQATSSHGAVSAPATVTVQVVDQPPSCHDFDVSTYPGGTVVHPFSLCSDPDGDPLTLSLVAPPAHGTATVHNTGVQGFDYTAGTGFEGTDTFTYEATDSIGAVSTIATVTVHVAFNTPAGSNVEAQLDSGQTVTFSSVSSPGETSAVSVPTTLPPPTGFQFDGTGFYWDVTTTATYTGPIQVCLLIPAGVTNPHLVHYVNGQPTDVTTTVTGNLVCGQVSSLSPFAVVTPITQPSALTYTGATHTVFGPTTLSARLAGASNAALAGDTVTFSVDGGLAISATTAADGTASATTALPLAPGAHTVSVGFAGDLSHLATHTSATVTVGNSARGSVTAVVPSLAAGGALELHAEAGMGGRLHGSLVYAAPGHKLYLTDTVSALGISADGRSAWVAGRDGRGHTFLAQAVDGGGRADTLRLWIDGVLVDGNGALRLGFVEVDSRR